MFDLCTFFGLMTTLSDVLFVCDFVFDMVMKRCSEVFQEFFLMFQSVSYIFQLCLKVLLDS